MQPVRSHFSWIKPLLQYLLDDHSRYKAEISMRAHI